MSMVNRVVLSALRECGASLVVVDVSSGSLDRSRVMRLRRVAIVCRAIVKVCVSRVARGAALYLSVSGGDGQIYDTCFVAIARIRGLRIYLHHHSYAYLDRRRTVTQALADIAGRKCTHVLLSSEMASQFAQLYSANNVVTVSNAALLNQGTGPEVRVRQTLTTIGFMGNICAEKGIWEFLELFEACKVAGLPLRARVAGPFQDAAVAGAVHSRLARLPEVEYVGPRYGDDKEVFWATIDALVFPTQYVNEAEPLTVLEALSHAVPVVAYGRGAIPGLVGRAGLTVPPCEAFVPRALQKLSEWIAEPSALQRDSQAALDQFRVLSEESQTQWRQLRCDMLSFPPVPLRTSGNRA
jgi:glycosyltransferase involved in cell wall biosynthesis